MTLSILFLLLFATLAFVSHAQTHGAESNQTIGSASSAQSRPAPTFQELIAQALQQPYPGPNGVPSKYVSDTMRILQPSEKWPDLMCAAGEIQGCPDRRNFPGPSSRSPVRWAHVRRLASLMPSRQWEGKWWRGSELGAFLTAPMYYTEPSTGKPILQPIGIGLGALPKQHSVLRPVMERVMDFDKKSPSELRRIKKFIKMSLKETLGRAKSKGTLVREDIGAWFQQILNYVVFHRNVSTEYAGTFYGLISPLIRSFVFSNAVPKHLWPMDPLGMRRIRAAMYNYMEEFKPLVQKHYGHLIEGRDCLPSRSCLDQLSYGFLDAFLQAGGLSMPSSIFTGTYISCALHVALFEPYFRNQ